MSNTLFVPIELDVLLANTALIDRDDFQRWKYSYVNLNDDSFSSPEPDAIGTGYDDRVKEGAYLHWTLPRSLRTARQGSSSDFPLIPNRWLIVRIHREAGKDNASKVWVVESDCPSSDANHASYFLVEDAVVASWKKSAQPDRKKAKPVKISTEVNTGAYTVNLGKAFDQTGWKEQAPSPMFLTAVAPGNIEFSAYMPFNEGILSFYDDLSDAPVSCTLSYFVTGWYSDPGKDIIATGPGGFTGGTTSAEVLTALNWTVAQDAGPGTIDKSLYTGMAFELVWEKNGESPPAPDQLVNTGAAKNLTVAVANTGVDAFSTLAGAQPDVVDGYSPAKAIELLRAFQYDMLPLLNQVNGEALLDEKVRQQWFNSKPGGTRWTITADDSNPGSNAPEVKLTPAEQAWLLQLNIDQNALDEALEKLYSLQWELNAVWWKYGFVTANKDIFPPGYPGFKLKDLEPFLDPTLDPENSKAYLSRVLAQLATVDGLLAKVPQPVTVTGVNARDAFLKGVAAFAKGKGIGAGKSLKAIAQPRYWQSNNPNVLISGVEPDKAADPDNALTVRLNTQNITGFTVDSKLITASTIGSVIPSLTNGAALPAAVQELYQEFFLLDPANAAQIAGKTGLDKSSIQQVMTPHLKADYIGTLPTNSLALWEQKWNPLYLEWEVYYTPIPFEWIAKPGNGKRTRNWTFDGTGYRLKTDVSGADNPESFGGRSLLSPHTQFTFGDRLKKFVDQYCKDGDELKELYKNIKTADNWKFLSQELVHFNEMLTQRDARAFRRPTVETFSKDGKDIPFAKVIGYPDNTSNPPYDTPPSRQGLVNTIPRVKIAESSDYPFHGIRSGQFYFNRLIVYDKFGRILKLIAPQDQGGLHDAANFPLVRDAAMNVTTNLTPDIQAPAQLPPRILQPARLDMLLVDQKDSSKILGLAEDVNPVCGWVIANHLDQSLLICGPDGKNMGEILLIQESGKSRAKWFPPPHGSITTVAQITAQTPQLGAFVTAAQGKTKAEFQALLGAIDSTLWTTDPLGDRTDKNMSVLIGRPLALVRLSLQFALDGTPLAPCDWPTPVKPPKIDKHIPDFTTSKFSIRFGDQAARDDGVIGYFTNQDYATFNSVVKPLGGHTYIKEIGPLGGEDGNYINLPFDGKTKEILTLLVDPRASIHATTGILPVKELTVPPQFVDKPLADMEATFRVGPLLSRILPASNTGGEHPAHPETINYLPVSEKNGTWSWWEKTVANPGTPQATTSWQGFGIKNPSTNATMNKKPATLRDGYLQFITDLAPE